jgi:hypothetical protein
LLRPRPNELHSMKPVLEAERGAIAGAVDCGLDRRARLDGDCARWA